MKAAEDDGKGRATRRDEGVTERELKRGQPGKNQAEVKKMETGITAEKTEIEEADMLL